MSILSLSQPYLLLIGDTQNPRDAKTAFGLRDWAPEACIAQLRFGSKAVSVGLADMSPRQAAAAGAKTLVVGIAPIGGRLPEAWYPAILEAMEAGMDVAAGLHQKLRDIPVLAERAAALGRKIFDVRHSDGMFTVASGLPRPGRRLLTVGTDCALGKKYTALALAKAMAARGHAADFRATGQTGILISGSGVAVDAVVADFIAGAAEQLSPANSPDHWDFIEGQGSLFHPAYAGVTLGLLHGSQPDALVLCHEPGRKTLNGYPHMRVVPLDRAITEYLSAGRLTNPKLRFVGVSLNTAALDEAEARRVLDSTASALDLPCVDPIRFGVEPIVEALEAMARV